MPPLPGAGPARVLPDRRRRAILCLAAVAVAVATPVLMRAVGLESYEAATVMQGGLAILTGLLAGPVAGSLTGALTVVIQFCLTGVPAYDVVGFVLMELAGYGLVAGLLARKPLSPLCIVLLAQVGGRLLRLLAIGFAADGSTALTLAIELGLANVRNGLLGIMLQWILVPLAVTIAYGRLAVERRQPELDPELG